MTADELLLERILRNLANVPGISHKKMFGCVVILHEGHAVLGVRHRKLIVRVGLEEYDSALFQAYVHEFDITGKAMRGWIQVDTPGWESDKQLNHWIGLSIEHSSQLKPKPGKVRMDRNYYDTFIRIAADCPTRCGQEPPAKSGSKSVPRTEYDLIIAKPYHYTQEEILVMVHALRQGMTTTEIKKRKKELHDEFFSKSRACLRASMLAKKYGWGIHFDAQGRTALVACESPEYAAWERGQGVTTVLSAMRNKRAPKK